MAVLSLCGAVCLGWGQPRPAVAFEPEAGLPLLDVFSPRDYRGHFQVWDITEDSAGLLYFGNLNKVLIYDGARWSHLAVPEAAFVRALAIDETDTLWIGGVDEMGYAPADESGERTFVSLKPHLPAAADRFGNIWAVGLTPDGVIFQSSSWLMCWNGREFSTLRLPDSRRWRMTQVGRETWLTDFTHGWFRLRFDGGVMLLEALPIPPDLQGQRAVGAHTSGDTGSTIIATDREGLWRWDGTAFHRFETSVDEQLRANRIYTMIGLSDGRLVLGSIHAGMRILDANGHQIAHFLEDNGLPDNSAVSLYATRDGLAVWSGAMLGTIRLDARSWVTWFHPANGAPRSKLYTPLRHRGELLVPGERGGLLHVIPASPDRAAHLQSDGISANSPNNLTAAQGKLLGTTAYGILDFDENFHGTPLPDSPVNATNIFPLPRQPGIWAAFNSDRVRRYRLDADGWHSLGDVPGIERVRSLSVDTDGSWWLGGPVIGVLHATFPQGYDEPPVIRTYNTANGRLPAGHGWTRFNTDQHGPLLTCNLGLMRYDPATDRFEPTAAYGTELADGSTHVNGSTPDDRGGLWMILRPADEDEASNNLRLGYGHAGRLTTLRLPRLTLIDDPTHLLHEPAAAGRPETLWIVGHAAMVRLNLDQWRQMPAEPDPILRIRTVTTGNGRRLAGTDRVQLPDHDHSLHVTFASVQLAAHPGATYESTFRSGSTAEVRTDQSSERNFSALGPGHHSLQLRAHYPGGQWSEPVSLQIDVPHPWWMRPLALTAYVTTLGLLIVAAWRWRVHRLMHRQHELEAAVRDRTAALAAQNEELERLRQIEFDEKLSARLAAEKARLEVLRYQLNPHFLFNTLNAICAQIIQTPRAARDTVIRLAEFCRLTLHRPDGDGAPRLREEIEMLRAYLAIEQTRLGELIEYKIEQDDSIGDMRLPPFLLLPLVENAVKYGAATSHDKVRICLSVQRAADHEVVIEVINSGEWIEPAVSDSRIRSLGIGLDNVRQRLTRYYPQRHEFTTHGRDGQVTVRLILRDTLTAPFQPPL
ncbi:sensor histidine kinase [Synoicihabitans lomoniglobus]|uniref:Histidine kinase n=1 Tax=Synoicihabitans lomoniglobus TaxID=2909285 RepID=A0AAF0CG92_9BACT|nr:histidine kinase [Opitutaceae bacterium LMO-M01]WED63302.1 histidine kinase [Opitutaceae bacterium LMO-M01]